MLWNSRIRNGMGITLSVAALLCLIAYQFPVRFWMQEKYVSLHQTFLPHANVKTVKLKRARLLSTLAKEYYVKSGDLVSANPLLRPSDVIPEKLSVLIPADALASAPVPTDLQNRPRAQIAFSTNENAIVISGEGAVARLADIARVMNDPAILEQRDNAWLLSRNILLIGGAILDLEEKSSWLRLRSDADITVNITAEDGNIVMRGMRVSSWDPSTQSPDTNTDDGRAYITQMAGRMDIMDSEIFSLGSEHGPADKSGAIYGLSWRTTNAEHDDMLVAGSIARSSVHDNYYGLYSYGSTALRIVKNEFYRNIQYGIAPHDDSRFSVIQKNYVHDNGKHGIMLSNGCNDNLMEGNIVVHNGLSGIMISKLSKRNTARSNIAAFNAAGITLNDRSSENTLDANASLDNKNGIEIRRMSSANVVKANVVQRNVNGVVINSRSYDNDVFGNLVEQNGTAVSLKETSGNYLHDNFTYAGNQKNVTAAASAKDNVIRFFGDNGDF